MAMASSSNETGGKIGDDPIPISPRRLDFDEITIVHFTTSSGQTKIETALVPKHGNSDDIKDLFRNAGEAGPCDIVKLYTPNGHLLNISAKIPPNDPTAPYRLVIVGLHCNGILVEEIGMDLLTLDKRISSLEERLKCQDSSSDLIRGLKESLTFLRHKLEEFEHLSWLGFYKALHPLSLPKESSRHPAIYHCRSSELKEIVCSKFLKISDVSLTQEALELLGEATFDNWQWEDEELLLLLQHMFLQLDLLQKFQIEINILRNFLMSVYRNYNDVPFHNFRHSFCVTQMMFGLVSKVKLTERVGDLETLILLTSCVCHDLDHPGYNNIYQINAQTELAVRYNDISPLENHHCSTAFRILQDHQANIFRNFPEDIYRTVREGMIRCILATDMARHNEILHQFREIVPYFESTNKTHVNLLSMVLIKVADISNEARPMSVAEPWLDCLLTEFFQQSDTEKLEGLPVTPFMDRDKITKPSSQCSFIGLVLLPLFEALATLFTELEPVIIAPVRYALDYYRRLNETSQMLKHRRSTDVSLSTHSQQHRGSTFSSSQPNSLCDHLPSESIGGGANTSTGRRTRDNSLSTSTEPSRPSSSVHRGSGSAMSLPPPRASIPGHGFFPSNESPGDSEQDSELEEAMTEVAVSERALKFKIATESSMELSASRKGSRENRSESSDQSAYISMLKDDSSSRLESESQKLTSTTEVCEGGGDVETIKVKSKESFFRRLRHFTEKLSSPRTEKESGSSSSRVESPNAGTHSPKLASSSQGFSYFRRPQSGGSKSEKLEIPSPITPSTSSSTKKGPNRVESDTEGQEPSGSSGSGRKSQTICGGSLDSILSKDERKSPVRRLMLPRFSSFVQKRTSRMGLLIRKSPKRTLSTPEKENKESTDEHVNL